jgi:glycosidase
VASKSQPIGIATGVVSKALPVEVPPQEPLPDVSVSGRVISMNPAYLSNGTAGNVLNARSLAFLPHVHADAEVIIGFEKVRPIEFSKVEVNKLRFRISSALSVAALSFGQATTLGQSASNGFWQAQSIYQIITDRFYDGDPANNNADGNFNASNSRSVHGGDFKGIEQKLDYIKALGATAIWISPVVVNANGEFHGYAGRDFYRVDPHWGSLPDLQHFTQAAHARGLLVIDDIIVNHGGDLINSSDSGYGTFVYPPSGYTLKYRSGSKTFAAPFDIYNSTYNASNNQLTNLFHNNGTIQDYGVTTQVTLGELSGLDDFRTESPYVRSNMAAIYQYWIQQAGFDGYRIDTTKHVELGFWQAWCPPVHAFAATNGRPNFFMFGEVFDGNEALCGSFTGTQSGGAFLMDSVLDYPLFFTVNSVFATATGNTKQIESHYNQIGANYDPAAQMRLVTFLDNHDQPRFLSSGNANGNTDRLQVALTFLYTSRGIPCLYYGTEQAFKGGNDPNDREDMFAGQFKDAGMAGMDSFNMTHPLFQLVAKLNNFRRLYPALQLGSHINRWNDPDGPGLFAYARRFDTQEVFVVFNTSASAQTLTNRSSLYPPGTQLINLLDTNEIITITAASQTPLIAVPPTTAKVFIAQTQMLPLDPVVVSNSPAHSVSNAPTYSAITLQFSKPMDTNSVQNAFGISPAVSGTFGWSSNHDTMTFTAGGSGLPGLANIVVRMTNSAVDAISSNAMFAPYELKFKTAATSFPDSTPPTMVVQIPTSDETISGTLFISGTATDNIAVAKIELSLDTGAWILANGTNSWSLNLNGANFLNGPHQISARATDTSGNISTTNLVMVRFFNVPGTYLQRVSGGNPANVTDCSGFVWSKDTAYSFGAFGYSGGTTGYVNNTINGICASAQSLYQREHYSTSSGGFSYAFDCPEGVYEITLLEAETYWNAAGKRLFNVFIQDRQFLTNFDVFTAAGGQNIPLALVFTNAVTNSHLTILFTPVVDNARVSGVQVRKIADVFSDADGIPDWWRLGYFGHALGSAGDHSRGSDDADGDDVSNLTEFLNGTSPLSAASAPSPPSFAITKLFLLGNDVKVSFTAASNWTFQLQRKDSLDDSTAWSDLGSALPGTGGTLTFTDSGGATNFERFYRIQAR